ncbi:Hypothetical protein BHY_1107 (plasmid) [Borrelia nietonii YOR]|uniref:Uncharacterized protein n=1 Tax=Borrelia nietonii YOR TaxID=1293576 RepID=W5SBG8_9SPIR|nr:hypothetical protein [Borrelia nietonii]AHH04058.1 Hypothetical protein BHY_1107 [Borrelia nietonii YOR]
MLLNVILISTFLIFSCSRSSSEEIEVLHDVNHGNLSTKMILRNDVGSIHMSYPDRVNEDNDDYNNDYLVLDFNISANKPLNLLKVSFNGIEVEHKYLRSSDSRQLELADEQYILPFDDAIGLTGFWIYLKPELNEYLKLVEFAKNEGLKFDVECVERKSGVKRNISFSFSVNGAQKFFDLVDKFKAI